MASYISSRAFIWHNVTIGEHAFILEDNTLQPFVSIGDNVTLWSGNHIGHSSKIADHCFIASQVVISGLCEIGARSFVGVNATFAEGSKIAEDNFIGMGCIVPRTTEPDDLFLPVKSEAKANAAKKYYKVEE